MTDADKTGQGTMITRAQRYPADVARASWAVAHVLLLAVLVATTGIGPPGWLAGTGYALALSATFGAALARSGARMGPADHVTMARAVLVGGVTALVVGPPIAGTPML